ncbi:hypothetical protein CEXT_535201 [Caerostris extrusa]|uniref:Uncharacterized protein n=1 Tax=Caerostris extrusa TaxID=172846 RepID=A0AAV4ML70_CAEEX|nr:hypothetical protein CEXT_535201 [Caerostris extrusa]
MNMKIHLERTRKKFRTLIRMSRSMNCTHPYWVTAAHDCPAFETYRTFRHSVLANMDNMMEIGFACSNR